jgi:hypothetical protein
MRYSSPFRYAAVKCMQAAIMGIFDAPTPRRPVSRVQLDQLKLGFMASRGLGKAYLASKKVSEPGAPEAEKFKTYPSVKSHFVALSPGQRIFGHISNRPAATKRNGGVRGSTATRWS